MEFWGGYFGTALQAIAWGLLPLVLVLPPTLRGAEQLPQKSPLPQIELQSIDLGTADWDDQMELDSPWPAELAPADEATN